MKIKYTCKQPSATCQTTGVLLLNGQMFSLKLGIPSSGFLAHNDLIDLNGQQFIIRDTLYEKNESGFYAVTAVGRQEGTLVIKEGDKIIKLCSVIQEKD